VAAELHSAECGIHTAVHDLGKMGKLSPVDPASVAPLDRLHSVTDTSGMTRTMIMVTGVGLAVGMLAPAALAGGPCRTCRTAAGLPKPYGDTGCGPRYKGAVHDDPWCRDPCDGCGRWTGKGCQRVMQPPEMLAPWQLPPGRGFQPASAFGYAPPPCGGCKDCGPLGR